MNWHELIFSEKGYQKYLRHFSFWMAWWLFFTVVTFTHWALSPAVSIYKDPIYPLLEKMSFVKSCTFIFTRSFFYLLIHILCCYTFIYIILPGFLVQRNYWKLVAGILLISIFAGIAGYFAQSRLFPLLNAAFYINVNYTKNRILWESINNGVINVQKIIALATIIKLLKYWWPKQKEKERLEREKIETELQLLKAQIHPKFLFNSLNNIYALALISSPKSPEMILKLSDILSYMLYECDDEFVPLEKEIKMLVNYMSLEKIKFGNKMEMNIEIKGQAGDQQIAPLLLFRFIEKSLAQCSHKMIAQPWVNLELDITHDALYMKLLNGKAIETTATGNEEEELESTKKRLELLYIGNHVLKIVEEPEISMVILEIGLKPPILQEATRGIFSEKQKDAFQFA